MPESKTLLLVDDEPGILSAYLRCLRVSYPSDGEGPASGVHEAGPDLPAQRVLVARSGEEALALVQREMEMGGRVACGYFDLKMPGGIDGLETIRRLREIDSDVLCTVVTAHVGDSLPELGSLFGAGHVDEWDYMAKPFSRAEIVQKTRQMIGSWNRRRREEEHLVEISRLNRELEAWAGTLESRIAERTAELAEANRRVAAQNDQLHAALEQLSSTQAQLVQSETLASIGQLAAGVAQEVSQPLDFLVRSLDQLGGHAALMSQFGARMEEELAATPQALDVVRRLQRESRVEWIVQAVPELVDQSRLAATHVLRIAGGLRAFSRGALEAALPVPVDEPVRAAVAASARELEHVRVHVALDAPACALIDSDALREALVHVIRNAAQACEDAGDGVVRVSTRCDGDAAVIEIADNGCGMSEDVMARAVEPFFTTHPDRERVGLGLSAAHGVVQRLGGDMSFTSDPGRGTRVTVRLPLLESATPTIEVLGAA